LLRRQKRWENEFYIEIRNAGFLRKASLPQDPLASPRTRKRRRRTPTAIRTTPNGNSTTTTLATTMPRGPSWCPSHTALFFVTDAPSKFATV